jgi:predicted  nucleic acid-binding Zn-ribbon protein
MPQVFRKKCNRCKAVWESPNNKGCPACGSPDFRFTDEPLTTMEVSGIRVGLKRCECSFCLDPKAKAFQKRLKYIADQIPKFNPEGVPGDKVLDWVDRRR